MLDPPEIESFEEWELGDDLQDALFEMEIRTPTPIQRLTIQPILDGRDIIAKAETGTGKTAAFGAPILAKIDASRKTILSLVLCPTRELAQQVAAEFSRIAKYKGLHITLIVGGEPARSQIEDLRKGAQIVVGTPGRVLDLMKQGLMRFPWCEFAVLDEADKMFEIGFIEDIREIFKGLPKERQTLLFSATYPRELLALARESTIDPVEVATAKGHATVENIEQLWLPVSDEDRYIALTRILENSSKESIFLIFCERRLDANRLLSRLGRLRFPVYALHGGYDQTARFKIMSMFREAKIKALVATDVASRGLDVNHVTHVINYSVPRELEEYTHRIGRTGRAGRKGIAVTFVMPRQQRTWDSFMRQAKWDVRKIEYPARRGDPLADRTVREVLPSDDDLDEEYRDDRGGRERVHEDPDRSSRNAGRGSKGRDSRNREDSRRESRHESRHESRNDEPRGGRRDADDSDRSARNPKSPSPSKKQTKRKAVAANVEDWPDPEELGTKGSGSPSQDEERSQDSEETRPRKTSTRRAASSGGEPKAKRTRKAASKKSASAGSSGRKKSSSSRKATKRKSTSTKKRR